MGGILLAAMMLQAATAASQPQIVVRGEAVVQINPDLATLEYDVNGEGKTSDEAVRALNSKARRVESALAALDPQITAASSDFKVVVIRGEDCKNDRYDNELKLSAGKCAIIGHIANQSFKARTALVDKSGTMVSAIARAGATSPSVDEFDLKDRKAAHAQAIAGAIKDGKRKAQAVAAASGATLGPLIDVELDDARESGETIIVTGSRVIRDQEFALAEPIPVNLKPAPEEVKAGVKMTYRLNR